METGNDEGIFRPEALASRQTRWMGEIVVAPPVSQAYLAALALCIGLALLAFLSWGTYTRRSTVTGQLQPESGVIKIYSPQPGIILEKKIHEGQLVSRGEILYVLSSERQTYSGAGAQISISKLAQTRKSSLQEQMTKTRQLEQRDRASLSQQIRAYEEEVRKLEQVRQSQEARAQLSASVLSRYAEMQAQGYVSKELLVMKESELLDQRTRLEVIGRDQIAVGRQLRSVESELESLSLRYESEYASLERQIASAEEEYTESEARRQLNIAAPATGFATAATGKVGQHADSSAPLVALVPADSKLEAHLYAPSAAIGFINVGDTVLLRYDAYPFQKFGQHRAVVSAVAKTALAGAELSGAAAYLASAASSGVPLYRITVSLNAQTINAYGQAHELQAGMMVEADVLQETRRLYEWILEPLYTLKKAV